MKLLRCTVSVVLDQTARLEPMADDVGAVAGLAGVKENFLLFERELRAAIDSAWSLFALETEKLHLHAAVTTLLEARRDLGAAERELAASARKWLAQHERWQNGCRSFRSSGLALEAVGGRLTAGTPESVQNLYHALVGVFENLFADSLDDRRASIVRELTSFDNSPDEAPPRRLGRRGRPSGSYKNLAFRQFVRDVLSAAENAGGHLTFSKSDPECGTLWPALVKLGAFLPAGLIPHSAPSSRLAEECFRWRRERTA